MNTKANNNLSDRLNTEKFELARHLFIEEITAADMKWYPDNRNSFHEWERFVKYAAEEAIIASEIFIDAYKKRLLEEGGGEDG